MRYETRISRTQTIGTRISRICTNRQTRISQMYTNVPTVSSGLMNVRGNSCNWCLSLCNSCLQNHPSPFQHLGAEIDEKTYTNLRGSQVIQHLFDQSAFQLLSL